MAKNNINALSEKDLYNVSGGRTRLTTEQLSSIKDELRKNDGGMGYAKKCREFGVNPDKRYLAPFVKDRLGF